MCISTSYSKGDYSDRFNPDIVVKGEFIAFTLALDQIGIGSAEALSTIQSGMQDITNGTYEAATNIEDISIAVLTLAETSSNVIE